ncbi:hypothetical protein [Oricola nitratireducens]|uniref:hypothetical protein n=1 Tax=Oricola nitratireducens TaxID=2775868 RepID=UPI0018669E76|nr:hypothetical protein [Oricola nitratireducens]
MKLDPVLAGMFVDPVCASIKSITVRPAVHTYNSQASSFCDNKSGIYLSRPLACTLALPVGGGLMCINGFVDLTASRAGQKSSGGRHAGRQSHTGDYRIMHHARNLWTAS